MTHFDLPDVDCHFCGTPVVRNGRTVIDCVLAAMSMNGVLLRCVRCAGTMQAKTPAENDVLMALVRNELARREEERREFARWMTEAWEAGE